MGLVQLPAGWRDIQDYSWVCDRLCCSTTSMARPSLTGNTADTVRTTQSHTTTHETNGHVTTAIAIALVVPTCSRPPLVACMQREPGNEAKAPIAPYPGDDSVPGYEAEAMNQLGGGGMEWGQHSL